MSKSDQPAGVAVDRGVMALVPERTYSRADLLAALAAERYACSIVVWMTLMEALEPDADDKGLDGWMREAEQRVKNRLCELDAAELGRDLYVDAQDAQKTRSQRMREAGFTRRPSVRRDDRDDFPDDYEV